MQCFSFILLIYSVTISATFVFLNLVFEHAKVDLVVGQVFGCNIFHTTTCTTEYLKILYEIFTMQ